METPLPISRRDIDKVCNSVARVPALDEYSSNEATKVFRERLRKQLIDKNIRPGPEALNALITYVTKRRNIACIKDYTFCGLQAGEAMSKDIAQASQDAFKVVVKKAVISTIVDRMNSIIRTFADRKEPVCTVHFRKEYSKMHNFTLREVVAMRADFVSSDIRQLYAKPPELGMLEQFEGDLVPESLRKLKDACLVRYVCKTHKPGLWNRMAVNHESGKLFSSSLLILRFTFDPQAVYARDLTMVDIVNAFYLELNEIKYKVSVAASSLQEGIVDLCVGRQEGMETYGDPNMHAFESELLILDSVIKDVISSHRTGGVPGVESMTVVSVDLLESIKSSQASMYQLANLGKALWASDNGLTNDQRLDDSVIVTRDIGDDDAVLYFDEETGIYYVYDYNPVGQDYPTDEELDMAYVRYYCGSIPVEQVWVLEIGSVGLRRTCISYEEEIVPILDYCGIVPFHVANHELVDMPHYVFVASIEDPRKVIKAHIETKLTPYDKISESGKAQIAKWASVLGKQQEFDSDPNLFHKNNSGELIERLRKYVYATLHLQKKKVNKTEKYFMRLDAVSYEKHVVPHAYQTILSTPYVDSSKTHTNDWFTNTYAVGADIARNIYADELYQLASASSNTDPRHIELFCDIVFVKGYPSGCGQKSSQNQTMGVVTRMGAQKQKQLLTEAFNQGPEAITSVDVATLFGFHPDTLGSRERGVAATLRMEKQERLRADIRSGRATQVQSSTDFASSEESLKIAIRSMFIAADPFNCVSEITTPAVFPNTSVMQEEYDSILVGSDDALARIASGVDAWAKRLSQYSSFQRVARKIELPKESVVVDLYTLYNFMLKHPFQ